MTTLTDEMLSYGRALYERLHDLMPADNPDVWGDLLETYKEKFALVAADMLSASEPAAPQGWQLALIDRSYDMRAKAIIAFNTAEQSGKDRDDALDAAWQAMLAAAPAAPAQSFEQLHQRSTYKDTPENDARIRCAREFYRLFHAAPAQSTEPVAVPEPAYSWLPISCAPRDGQNILIRFGRDGVSQAKYVPGVPHPWKFIDTNDGITWLINGAHDDEYGPSHWMPMPSAANAEPASLQQSAEAGEPITKEWCMKMAALEPDEGVPPAGLAAQPNERGAAMTLGERIAHVGGRENAAGYIEFGSVMAIDALIQHVLRDARIASAATVKGDELTECDDDLPDYGLACEARGWNKAVRAMRRAAAPQARAGLTDGRYAALNRAMGDAMINGRLDDLRELSTPFSHPAGKAEDAKDAARYRWLAERFTGYDFDWMPSAPNAADGISVAVFEIGREFRGGRDFTAALDATMTAAQPESGADHAD